MPSGMRLLQRFNVSEDMVIRPAFSQWQSLIARRPEGTLLGRALDEWRRVTRKELGLAVDRPVIATGHQALLWHPGILAKYLAVNAFARANELASANLVVDQHVGRFGDFEIPIRKVDGSLGVRRLELCRPPANVPMGRFGAFAPLAVPANPGGAILAVDVGVQKIFGAVSAHRAAPNAALQMAAAIADLMRAWVQPMPDVTATDLVGTSLGVAMMKQMAADPVRCAECYNRAVQAVPEAGIGPLMIRDDYIELPLWRIREDGERMRAYDGDAEQAIGNVETKTREAGSKIDLLPRALLMTALVRLGMCDLFVHGTGGAIYDRAMELWVRDWLGVEAGSIAVVTADVRLPLSQDEESIDLVSAIGAARRAWHDPDLLNDPKPRSGPSRTKEKLIREIEAMPRSSPLRRAKFLEMHDQLAQMRQSRAADLRAAQMRAEDGRRRAGDQAVAAKRDWTFPLYPTETIDELARTIGQTVIDVAASAL